MTEDLQAVDPLANKDSQTQTDEETEQKPMTQIFAEEFTIYAPVSSPDEFLVISIITTLICLLTGSIGFFFAALALYMSLQTIEFNAAEELEISGRTSIYALILNLVAVLILVSGFLLVQLAMYTPDNWSWIHLYAF
jgi:hypothetical protein